ncbi:unnamed protein product [Rotaria sp. Silwood1]|nr:unnamed protein product [Rotaria sp. Silwood1]CAF1632263.1 unnamed protein product [Rotaria sp. Silwood1]
MRTLQVAKEEIQPHRLRSLSKTRWRSRRKARSSSSGLALIRNANPESQSPKQRLGRAPVRLFEEADSEIRYQFQLLLSEKIYPTTTDLLQRLHAAHDDFPILSKTTLRRNLYRIKLSYKSTKRIKIPLGHVSFVAQRARYYRKIDELRAANALIFYHDKSWLNIGEVKQFIWVDSNRIAISAMMNINGFHLPSVDIFSWSKLHSVNAEYFLNWIEKAAFHLREDNGRNLITFDHLTLKSLDIYVQGGK